LPLLLDVSEAVLARRHPKLHLSTIPYLAALHLRASLQDKNNGVLFIWGPDSQAYQAHTSNSPVPLFQTEDQ